MGRQLRVIDIPHVQRVGELYHTGIGKFLQPCIEILPGVCKSETYLLAEISGYNRKSPSRAHDHDLLALHGGELECLHHSNEIMVVVDTDNTSPFKGSIYDCLIIAQGSGMAHGRLFPGKCRI